jgi:low temperature requirement protein LtrA
MIVHIKNKKNVNILQVLNSLFHTYHEVGEHQGAFRVKAFSATFNNISVISWQSVLLMEEKPTELKK